MTVLFYKCEIFYKFIKKDKGEWYNGIQKASKQSDQQYLCYEIKLR